MLKRAAVKLPDSPTGVIEDNTSPSNFQSKGRIESRNEGEEFKQKSRFPPKKVKWLTRAMAEEFTRDDVLFTTFKEAILYIFFVVAVTIFTIGRRSPSMFYITQALKDQFLEKEFYTVNDVEITFYDIKSVNDFWHYSESLLLDSFFFEHYHNPYNPNVRQDDRIILYENKLLGVPRIRQVKVRNDSCEIHAYFKRMFVTCYDTYSVADEDRNTFGLNTGTAWVHQNDSQTQSLSYPGTISTYKGAGFYQDLTDERESTASLIANLKEHLWIRRGTRAIFIDFSLYNANLNLFVICKLIFELPPTGGVIPSHAFQALQLIHHVTTWDYVTTVFEWLVYVIAAYFIIEELREIMYFKFRYLLQFWSYIDVTIITLATASLITSLIGLPHVGDAIEKIKNHPKKYGNLEYLGRLKDLYNDFTAFLLFFSYVKLFKYLNFNKTMGQLNNTLKRCAMDILGFSIMFFIIFFAFAELGYLLFGSEVEDFSSFGVSMFTLLRTILGDFDYQAIEKANRILAPLYFLSYIFFVFFVLLNMFLAIINDTYADVKTEIAIAPDEMQMSEFLKQGLYKILAKLGCKIKMTQEKAEFNTTVQQIRDALKKCRFSDLEIEMFFARYNIDPLAEVGDFDVKNIMKELEAQSVGKSKKDDDTALVHVSDFITQQERLNQIERSIQMLSEKIDALLRKLEALENVRKARPTG